MNCNSHVYYDYLYSGETYPHLSISLARRYNHQLSKHTIYISIYIDTRESTMHFADWLLDDVAIFFQIDIYIYN